MNDAASDNNKATPAKPWSMRVSMNNDEAGTMGGAVIEMASKAVASLMWRTLQHGGRVTLECDARNVSVQWTPEEPL